MRRALRPRPGARLPARPTAPSLVLLVVLLTAGCSGEEGAPPSGEPLAEPSAAPTLGIEPVTSLGRVTGALPRKDARTVEGRVSRIALRWLRDAYVEGRYPRERFNDSFTGFGRGARAAARRDLRVMTNAAIGRRVEQVTPTRMDVEVDLLAVDRRAVGATARVLTTFRTEGRAAGRHRVSGRLALTKDEGRWTVFAYHVRNGGR